MPDPASHDAVHLWLVLLKAYRSLRAHAEQQVRSLGIGFSDFAVLEALLHKGPLPVNTIGSLVHLTSGSITTAVDRLVEKGLVSRCVHASDRRARMVSLTEMGRVLIEAAFARHAVAMDLASGGLTAAERDELTELLRKLGKFADEALHSL